MIEHLSIIEGAGEDLGRVTQSFGQGALFVFSLLRPFELGDIKNSDDHFRKVPFMPWRHRPLEADLHRRTGQGFIGAFPCIACSALGDGYKIFQVLGLFTVTQHVEGAFDQFCLALGLVHLQPGVIYIQDADQPGAFVEVFRVGGEVGTKVCLPLLFQGIQIILYL